jgi:hypothetical protein
MSAPKKEWVLVKEIAFILWRIATSPLAWRTALFFFGFMALLVALVFGAGISKFFLITFPPVLLLLSAILAFRMLANHPLPPLEGPCVYDKAEYHYDGDFPKGLPRKHAFVHTGMFVGWLIEHDMIAPDFLEETQRFKERKKTGAQVYKAWDGSLTSDVLTDEGNAFAKYYYGGADGNGGPYFDDYEATLTVGLPGLYHVKDTWENYDTIKQKIDLRYEAWKQQK